MKIYFKCFLFVIVNFFIFYNFSYTRDNKEIRLGQFRVLVSGNEENEAMKETEKANEPVRDDANQSLKEKTETKETPPAVEENIIDKNNPPDIAVLDIDIDTKSYKITSRIANIRKTGVLKNIDVGIYSNDIRSTIMSNKLYEGKIAKLKPGRENAVYIECTTDMANIYKYIVTYVDYNKKIEEFDEENNIRRNKTTEQLPPGYMLPELKMRELDLDKK